MTDMKKKAARSKITLIAAAFLLPNFLGFLIFTAGPVVFSLYMAFTNWSLVRHNDITNQSPSFIGFENFKRLLVGDESRLFWESFYNTAYLMIGIPIGIAGSLIIALALNRSIGPTHPRRKITWSLAAVVIGSIAALAVYTVTWPGSEPTTAQIQQVIAESQVDTASADQIRQAWQMDRRVSLAASAMLFVVGLVVALGLGTGVVFFRTLFYLPSLLSGIALFLLWKSLYKPTGGAINEALRPFCDWLQRSVMNTPAALWYAAGFALWGLFLIVCLWMMARTVVRFRDRDFGLGSVIGRTVGIMTIALIGFGFGYWFCQLPVHALFPTGFASLGADQLTVIHQQLTSSSLSIDPKELALFIETVGREIQPHVLIESISALTHNNIDHSTVTNIIHESSTSVHIGLTSGDGLQPPNWLVDTTWAKPALIMMGVWTAVGGANMLLYLAGLSNIPEELYEAADIDGAGPWNRFWNVTWPQLAPTTFFIVIMSTIGGLQGGFDQARAMTEGKYGTEVLTYYLYKLAFTDEFQLGLASAVAWIMFVFIFFMTAINYRFGSKLVND